jgi:hypothetical protein
LGGDGDRVEVPPLKNAKITERSNDKSHAYYRGGENIVMLAHDKPFFGDDKDKKVADHKLLCRSIIDHIKIFKSDYSLETVPSNNKNTEFIEDFTDRRTETVVTKLDNILKTYGLYELFQSFFCSDVLTDDERKVNYYFNICYGIMQFLKDKFIKGKIVTSKNFIKNMEIITSSEEEPITRTHAFNNMISEAITIYNLYFYNEISLGVPITSVVTILSGEPLPTEYNRKNNKGLFFDDDYTSGYDYIELIEGKDIKYDNIKSKNTSDLQFDKNKLDNGVLPKFKDKIDKYFAAPVDEV